MAEGSKYLFETFKGGSADFDSTFSDWVNNKYSGGWKYKDCQFESSGGERYAYCLFKSAKWS